MNIQSRTINWKAPFFAIWTGQAFSLIGSKLAQFALVWWLTQMTGSATVLATATLVAVLPGVVLGPLAGALVDRWNRRLVMVVADGFIALVSLWLAILFWQGTAQVWHIFVAMLARSLGDAFHWPSMQASTALMVPDEHLARVAGLNQSLRGTLSVVAPPLGAILMSLLPMQSILGIDVVTALLAITPLMFVTIPQPKRTEPSQGQDNPTIWSDMRSGFQYLASWPGVMALIVIAMIINFVINPAFSLMPLLVTNHFNGEALQLGWLESAYGVGAILGGLLLSIWGGFRRRVVTTMVGLVVSGVGVSCVGLAPADGLEVAIMGLFIAGFMNPLVNGPLVALMQSLTAPEMHGRVFTLVGSLSSAMMPLSLAVAGPVSDLIGIRTWYVVGGIIFSLMGVIAFTIPAIMHLEDSKEPLAPQWQAETAVTTR